MAGHQARRLLVVSARSRHADLDKRSVRWPPRPRRQRRHQRLHAYERPASSASVWRVWPVRDAYRSSRSLWWAPASPNPGTSQPADTPRWFTS